ncbi:MAG: acetolactate synthase small subunit [Clostridia bacterium]|nr:acetolactate synthase small subunit [Eubacterium sp.]MBQ9599944.1 acetolactate synthase small subunit [Clostridia bacterium]
MKEKLILSVLVDNESGVLQRVASLFSRRGYNISSLTVSETEDEAFSRMTIETYTEPENFRQIKRQLAKLEIVKKVSELTDLNSVSSELLLIKVKAQGVDNKNAILAYNLKFGARVLDVSLATITLEFTGTGDTIDEFVKYLDENFGIVELARTGVTSLQRGEGSFTDDLES